jgi:hypothetical protein
VSAAKQESDETVSKPYMLMVLRSGCLRHVIEDDDQQSESDPPWCRYPPPMVGELNRRRLEHDLPTLKKWFIALPLIKALLPAPYIEVAPYSNYRYGGEMKIGARLQHTQLKGEVWMATGEIDLMVNILLWDGRYNDIALIFSCGEMQSIENTFFIYRCYTKAQQMFNDAEKDSNADMEEVHKDIVKLYQFPVHELARRYVLLRDNILRKLVAPNAGILSRRVLVFPTNEKREHWSATFVFNPSFIDDDKALRACFFRYCSINPDGRRRVKTTHGISWFLNLCYSVNKHEAKQALCPNSTLRMMFPFGNTFDGYLSGTKDFPALFLPENSVFLPKQRDGYNCGIGVAMAIGIILRDIIHKDIHDPNTAF